MNTRFHAFFVATALIALPFAGWAGEYRSELDKKIKSSQEIGALGDGLAGDQTNYYTGTTSFSATDISLPGNGLGLSLSRTYVVESEHQVASVKAPPGTSQHEIFSTRRRLFGDWDLDIPSITTIMTQSGGWVVDSDTPTNRCSVVGQTGGSQYTAVGSPPYATLSGFAFSPDKYWSGYTLNAGGSQSLLVAPVSNTQRPSTGGPYHWTTKQDWWVSCLGSIVNGAGQGFFVVSPTGTKYTFNRLSKRNVTSIWDRAELDPEGYGWQKITHLFRAEYAMLPTRMEDRFGNWTTYNWSDPGDTGFSRLDSMSTGFAPVGGNPPVTEQTISLSYNTAGFVSTATDGTRTWTYVYSGSNLLEVILPDTAPLAERPRWKYDFYDTDHIDPYSPMCVSDYPYGSIEWVWDCFGNGGFDGFPSYGPSNRISVTHPSGARVDFDFALFYEFTHNNYGGYPLGLLQKTISGPGLATSTWRVSQFPDKATAKAACQASNCPTTRYVDVLAPDGRIERNIFGVTAQDQGLQLGKLVGSTLAGMSGGSPALTTSTRWGTAPFATVSPTSGTTPTFYQEFDYRYVPSSEATAYTLKVGSNPLGFSGQVPVETYASERRIPVYSTIQTLQGTQFKSEVPADCAGLRCYTVYAQPTRRVASSMGGTGGNFTRTDTSTYQNDSSKWVLGLMLTSGCINSAECGNGSGRILKRTEYDPTTLLPWKTFGIDQVNPETTLTYNVDGTVATAKEGLNHQTTLGTWKRGVPTGITFPNATTISADVSASGAINWTKDEFNSQTCYGYDLLNRLTSITYTAETAPNSCLAPANGGAWTSLGRTFLKNSASAYGLPADHWQQTVTTGNARTITYYDARWQPVLVRTEDTANVLTRSFVVMRYDGLGRKIFKSYPVATLTSVYDTLKGVRTTYDGLGRVVQVQQDSENVDGQTVLNTNTSYVSGFRTQVTNPRAKVTTTAYQVYDSPSTDAPVSILHPASVVTTIARQASLGKPLSVTRSGPYGGTLSATRSYVYDSNERLCKTINPESNSALVEYDLAGNVRWSADGTLLPSLTCDRSSVPLGDRTTRTYDTMNRVTAIDTPGGTADVDTTYHADGAVHQLFAANPGGYTVTSTYRYNRRRLLTEEYANNSGIVLGLGYAYNANAHLSHLTYPDGQVVGYSPDALGRTTQVASGSGQVYASGVGYHPTGAISGFTYGNQIVHAMTPNIRQLPGRSWDVHSGTTFLDDSYAYDANGNVDAITDALPVSATSHTRDLGYDDLDRLIVADAPNVWGTATYSYDPLDNLRSVTIANQGVTTRSHFYNYTANNQLSLISGPIGQGAYGFAYDNRGNTTWKNVATGNCAAYPVLQCAGKVPQTFVFDRANRLSQVTGVQTYRYDGLGRRVQTTDADGKTTFWLYSQAGQVLYSSEARRSQNIGYIYLGNTQVATRSVAWGTGVATVRYQHTDALGSPVVETDASRNVIKRNVFSPWGEAWGTTVVDGTGYTGHVMDQGTGLTYMQQRYYDPQIGRFLSVDPVSALTDPVGYFGRYHYAANNPYKFTDPDGRAWGLAAKVLKVVVKGGDVAATVAGAVEDGKVLFSRDASLGQRVIAGASLATEVFSPVSARDVKAGIAAVKSADAASDAKRASTLTPGPYARESIPAHRGRPSASEQRQINEIGDRNGCHTCGAPEPGTKYGDWIGDHQPAQALDEPKIFLPHCNHCKAVQGGQVLQELRKRGE